MWYAIDRIRATVITELYSVNGEQCCRTPEEGTVTNPIHPSEVYFMHLCVVILQEKKNFAAKWPHCRLLSKISPDLRGHAPLLWSKRAGGVWGEVEEGRGRRGGRGGQGEWFAAETWSTWKQRRKTSDIRQDSRGTAGADAGAAVPSHSVRFQACSPCSDQ